MKLALPVDEQNLDSPMCISFGRTPYFMFYNTETKECTYFDNGAISVQGGAGIKASQVLVDEGINVLLSIRCGENAAEVLVEGGLSMYKTTYPTARENIAAFLANELAPLTELKPSLHNHG